MKVSVSESKKANSGHNITYPFSISLKINVDRPNEIIELKHSEDFVQDPASKVPQTNSIWKRRRFSWPSEPHTEKQFANPTKKC